MKRKTLGIHNFMIRFGVSVCVDVFTFSAVIFIGAVGDVVVIILSLIMFAFFSFRCCRLNVYFEHQSSFTQGRVRVTSEKCVCASVCFFPVKTSAK